MKYADKIWKYLNLASVYISTGESDGSTFKRRVMIKITGSEDKKLLNGFVSLLTFLIAPTIMTYVIAALMGWTQKSFFAIFMITMNIVIPFLILGVEVGIHNVSEKNLTPLLRNIDIYKRDLPSNLRPAHVYMLLYDGSVNSISVAATLLDLVDRGYLKILRNSTGYDKSGFFSDKKMTLILTDKSQDDLLRYEKYLINWFIKGYGDGKQVDNDKIQLSLKTLDKGIIPSEAFEYFQSLVVMSFPFKRYYKKLNSEYGKDKDFNSLEAKYSMLSLMIGFVPIPFVTSIIIAFLLAKVQMADGKYVMTQRAVDEKDSWLDLKKYLMDFTFIKEKTIEDVKLYNFYLVYAIVLSANKNVTKEIMEFFGENLYIQDFKSCVDSLNAEIDINPMLADYFNTEFSRYKLTEEDIKQIEMDIESESAKYNLGK